MTKNTRDTGTPKKTRGKSSPKKDAKPKAKAKKPASKKSAPPKPKTAIEALALAEDADGDVNFSKLPPWPDPRRFLVAFRRLGNVAQACKAAEVGRTTVYRRRQQDEEFALAWADVEEETTDEMEREAFRRGVEGVDEPVFYKGERIGWIRNYSDTLLIFMLKARKPEKYRERVDHRHSGDGAAPSKGIDVSKLSLPEARKLRELLAKATPEKSVPSEV